ncbi:D-amino acid aminotransferase [Aliidiomarina taiwanensis]|uniref:Aminodeoxychorismate lyase n=1 Tax=Aliidiomarina taiwanensis TaxID=946228 RepID=A0A432X914_9GAMM|nr:D-amino acid aminotransferase [Aliidiomarina taiwanensis]RUO43878.1 D-amino acid aminotransferase [Aliidiomarina taiwanensis]
MSHVFINGQWCQPEEAVVSVFDRGFLFADGVYEVVPFYTGYPLLFDDHYERLERSLAQVGIDNPYQREEWLSICQTLAESTPEANGIVYIQVTRGAEYPRNHLPEGELTPTVMATASPWVPPVETPDPVHVEPFEDIRWLRCDIKSISLLGNIMLKQEAKKRGAFEPLLHRNGRVTEGASCNYFMVKDGCLYTPPNDELILGGITREWILELAESAGIEVKETAFSLDELMQADECFLSSSTREVQPVGTIGSTTINNGSIGPITQQLAELFRNRRPHIVQE